MFGRRVKILLGLLLGFCCVLAARAGQLQVIERGEWGRMAAETLKRTDLLRTSRGSILDVKGRAIARDVPANDACVDFRAMQDPPDPKWVYWTAKARLKANHPDYAGATYERRKEMLAAEQAAVLADLDSMWAALAKASDKTPAEIQDVRRQTVARVEGRREAVNRRAYSRDAKAFAARGPAPWWRRWIAGGAAKPPEWKDFAGQPVAEETQAHVVLPAIDTTAYNFLYKNLDRLPGLTLRPSTTRAYPYGVAACHVLGRLSGASPDDLKNDPNAEDELRSYQAFDLVGRAGLEKLWERELRGARGKVERDLVTDQELSRVEAVPGRDVRATVDIELEKKVQAAFLNVRLRPANKATGTPELRLPMPGAAVVIDLPTGQVRAMASYPDFDPNRFDDLFPALAADAIGRPLMNRATQFDLEPGSTMKTITGLGAITDGLLSVTDTIECTGYLKIDGRTYNGVDRPKIGRCWTMRMFGVGHHSVPYNDPHPTGFLTYSQALERSCNVFFETTADKLGIDRLSYWMRQFGLGKTTGIGLPEVAGLVPDEVTFPAGQKPSATWFAGIGQGPINATPIQMANVAATIARDGVWVRPTLATDPAAAPKNEDPDRVDLRLSPAGLVAAHRGMMAVVESPAGTGTQIRRPDMLLAAKSGTPQAAALFETTVGPDGKLTRRRVRLGTDEDPNPEAPWYRGTFTEEGKEVRSHAWLIGYAPADNPKIAFAVFIEYGYSGGVAAGSVADVILQACVDEGYIKPTGKPGNGSELMNFTGGAQ